MIILYHLRLTDLYIALRELGPGLYGAVSFNLTDMHFQYWIMPDGGELCG